MSMSYIIQWFTSGCSGQFSTEQQDGGRLAVLKLCMGVVV